LAPNYLLASNATKASVLFYYRYLFVQRKPPDEPVAVPKETATLFMKVFNPRWSAPLQYIGSVTLETSKSVGEICDVVRSRLGTDASFTVYEEYQTCRVKKLPAPDGSLADNTVANGYCLVFEGDFEASGFEPGAALPKPVPAKGSSFAEFLATQEMTVPGFYTREMSIPVRISVFSWADSGLLLGNIECPGSLKFDDFSNFVVWATHIEYDPGHDTLLLYRKDYYFDRPGVMPLVRETCSCVETIFPQSTNNWLYVRVVKGFTPDDAKVSIVLMVLVSLDGRVIASSKEVFLPKGCTFQAL
jgi:hypothetical protein